MTRGWIFVAGTVVGATAVALAFGLLGPAPTDRDTLQLPAEGSAPQVAAPVETSIVATQVPAVVPASSKLTDVLTQAAPPKVKPNPQWDALVSGTVEDALKPDRSAEWDALVSGMLEYEVERRFGRQLDLVQQQRLLDALAQVRYASLGLQEEPGDAGSPTALRARLSRTLAILQADRIFREEIGIGVSEFLQGLDADAVEDVAPTRTNH
jgi:hypothetical protein